MRVGGQELFKEKHYGDLDGGILEGFGRLLKFDLKLYVYPTLDDRTGELITADNVKARTAALPKGSGFAASSGVPCFGQTLLAR